MIDGTISYTSIDSPVGTILIAGNSDGLTEIRFEEGPHPASPDPTWRADTEPFVAAVKQLQAYFAGRLREFDLRLAPKGTPFQLEVRAALQQIPYGATISYAELARRIGRPRAVRAVGAANGRNPLAIVVPCHRVIGSDGSLTGYGGGLGNKDYLLTLERDGIGAARKLVEAAGGGA